LIGLNKICCAYGMSQKKGVVHMIEQNNTGNRKEIGSQRHKHNN